MSLTRKAVRSVLFNWVGFFSHIVVSYLTTPVIVHSLGKGTYGLWSLVISVTGYYGLLNFGVRSSLTKYLAEVKVSKNNEALNRLINSSLVFFTAIPIVILIITFVLTKTFNQIFVIDDVDIQTTQLVITVVGVNLAIGFLFKPFEATLVAYNRFDFLNAVGVTFSIVRAISIVIVLKSGYGVVEMAYTILFLDMLNHVVIFCLSKKIFAGLQLGCKFVHKDSVTKLINFGFFNFLREISRFILNKTDTILVGIFLGTSVVAVYAIAESLISYTSSITKGITRVLLPLSSELNAKDQTAKIKKIMLLIPKYIFLGSVFIWTEFYFLGDQFILLWLGTGFHESYIIFCILMAARVSVMTHDIMVISVVGIGKNKFFGWLSVFEMLANLTLSLILVKKIGLLGVAFGTLLPLLITRSIIVPVYCSKIVHISLKEYLSNIISPTVVCSIPYVLVTSQLVLLLPPDNYLTLCLNFLLSFLVLMIFFYRFLEIEIKKTIVKTFGRFAWSR